jgi:D-alanyl-D-alanine carboxypeptidase
MTTQTTINPPRRTPHPGRRRRRAAAASVAASALAALFAMTVAPAGASAHEREAPRPVAHRLQAILDRAVKSPRTTYPGAALYVRAPGRGTWAGAAGRASIKPATRMRAGDRFRAGSIMKPFVAAATLQLVEEARFALDDPLVAVLPPSVTARFPDADRITVRMLLNHTSGIAEYSDARHEREILASPRRRWTVSELLDRAAAKPRSSVPGARHAYSNANYNLLGLVLEQATGQPWRAVVRERVIERLHLAHTSLPEPGDVPTGRDIAHGYELVHGELRDVTDVDSSMAGAAGGNALLTTTEDLSRFLDALLDGRLFQRQETLDAMRTFVAARDAHGLAGYGLGLERYVLPGGVEMIGHMGTAAGYRALMFHLPAQDIDIALAINTPDDPTPVLMPALELLVAKAS